MRCQPGDLIAIPAGYIMGMACEETSAFLRYGHHATADSAIVKTMIGDLLSTYAFLNESDYKVVHDII